MRWDHKLAPYDNAGLVISRAVQVMTSEPRGPAYLALPRESAMTPIESARFPLVDHLRPAGTPAPRPVPPKFYAPVYEKAKYESVLSVNDRCPVKHGRLNSNIRPTYVNRQPVGFC